jgi:hypothetical protein
VLFCLAGGRGFNFRSSPPKHLGRITQVLQLVGHHPSLRRRAALGRCSGSLAARWQQSISYCLLPAATSCYSPPVFRVLSLNLVTEFRHVPPLAIVDGPLQTDYTLAIAEAASLDMLFVLPMGMAVRGPRNSWFLLVRLH